MAEYDFRVFLSYRGTSTGKNPIGQKFSEDLYNYLKADPLWKEMYGNVYYSPITKAVDMNFKKEIPEIMSKVEYFVMPLTNDYYDNFWDRHNNCPNENSITYKEIQAAITNNCRFICVSFPGFENNSELLTKIFGERADELLCVAPLTYKKARRQEIFREIANVVRKRSNAGSAALLADLTPNVYLSFKQETENKDKYPFYARLKDVKKLTLLNFAGTSFIAGVSVASIYEECDTLKKWFNHNLINGNIEANLILVNPHSYAAHDAALFKMYPDGLTIPKRDIISTNMNKLSLFMQKNPEVKLNVYLTDIALPYGVMLTEYEDKQNNHMKVDLYASVINDDLRRPSFYMLQSDPKTKMLYSFFEDNVKTIMNNHAFKYTGHPDIEWLLNKHIIHRGRMSENLVAHTQAAYDACIKARYPVEVDLLLLPDDTIVVGRKEERVTYNGIEMRLGDCTKSDLRKHNEQAGNKRIFALEEFLEYIDGKIPVLFEIKREAFRTNEERCTYAMKIIEIIKRHFGRASYRRMYNEKLKSHKIASHEIAFHSSDPYVLEIIKSTDCMIPCGIISMDFSGIRQEVGEEFYQLHANKAFFEVFSPDFISYKIADIDNDIKNACKERKIPLLGWTVTDEEVQQLAFDRGCNNVIIEESKSYL